jgi:hypothetical protein
MVRTTMARALMATALLAAVLPGAPAHAAPKKVVTIHNYLFSEPVIQVELGQAIEWRNLEVAGEPVPQKKPHNLIEDIYIPPSGVPLLSTKRICDAFPPGAKCAPDPTTIDHLLPAGIHILTCTIDRDHSALMRHVVQVS